MQPAGTANRVHWFWRTLSVGLLLGIAAHYVFAARQVMSTPFAVRGDALPDPDPRLMQVLDKVDFDRTPLASALDEITHRAGLRLSFGQEVADSVVTVHMLKIDIADALDSVLLALHLKDELLWDESDGTVHVCRQASVPSSMLFVRLYDIPRILDSEKTFFDKAPPENLLGNGPIDEFPRDDRGRADRLRTARRRFQPAAKIRCASPRDEFSDRA